jgi:hypothetical protein
MAVLLMFGSWSSLAIALPTELNAQKATQSRDMVLFQLNTFAEV